MTNEFQSLTVSDDQSTNNILADAAEHVAAKKLVTGNTARTQEWTDTSAQDALNRMRESRLRSISDAEMPGQRTETKIAQDGYSKFLHQNKSKFIFTSTFKTVGLLLSMLTDVFDDDQDKVSKMFKKAYMKSKK